MEISMILIFVIGYLAIALEHITNINKAAISLLMTAILWVIYACISPEAAPIQILHQLGEVSSIVCFIFGAMVVVELVDSYGGFSLIAHIIKTKNRKLLLLLLSVLTFFMSATLDNMTTTIIMIAIMYKLIQDPTVRLWFASIIVLAANSGGAWSPIGDVTTIMLWVKGNVTTEAIIPHLILPSIVSLIVPLSLSLGKVNGNALDDPNAHEFEEGEKLYPQVTRVEKAIISLVGVLGLVSVPVFKSATGLPPFMGVLFVMGLLWFITEIIYKKHDEIKESKKLRIPKVIKVVDIPTVLFFFGILMAVGALQEQGLLKQFANLLDSATQNVYLITGIIGVLSSIISLVGVLGLVSVPVFKSATGLPPFMGVLFVMGLLWFITEIIYKKHDEIKESKKLRIPKVIKVVDIPTVLFFFGILMAVGALQEQGLLKQFANLLDSATQNVYLITGIIGVLSSIIDNVPLVAAAMGMYPLADPNLVEAGTYAAAFVQDGIFWELLAYCAGVGGSLLIIGSAAGIVAMGMTKISFGWYFKNITWRAFLGYLAGILVYILTL